MTARVYLSPPDVGQLEEDYVLDALRSGWVAPAGAHVDAFEREVARRVGVGHAAAVSAGTAGLHLALLALGVGPGDVVIVPTMTFAATANAVVYTGASPYFVDVSPVSGNLDVGLVGAALARLRAERAHVAAVIPVDLFGSCVDYTSLLPLCDDHRVPVLEDAAEAIGASHCGQAAGSFGRAAVLSFNGNKIMTTSGGGMVLSDDADLVQRCRYLAGQARQPVAHYEHTEIGYNYRLSNVLAALGRAQLVRLDEMMARRKAMRDRYAKLFAGHDGVRLLAEDDLGSNGWLTTVAVEPAQAGWRASELADHLGAHDIETRPLWKPLHLQPVFAGCRGTLTGAAQELFDNGLALPSGSALTGQQADRVADAIGSFLEPRS